MDTADRASPWTRGISALVSRGAPPSPAAIDALVGEERLLLGERGVVHERTRMESRLLGLGPLSHLVAEDSVTDILVNGDGSVWVDRGAGVVRCPESLDPGAARALAVRLAGQSGRRLDDAQPWVDGMLPGGFRLHAILPPLVTGGAHLSLRIPRVAPEGLDGLLALGMVPRHGQELLERILRARLSFLVVGGTGTGKTTLLGGLLAACPVADRIVIVEDVRELMPRHPHVVHLQGRSPNVEGSGGVTMVDLVRQALRMRPDRLIIGEVRGAEVRELLAALNTGHAGGGGTLHANAVTELPARLEALGALAGMTPQMVATQLLGGVHVVFGMVRRGRARLVSSIGVTGRGPDGGPEVTIAWDMTAGGEFRRGPAAETLEALIGDAR
ncbi:MAG: TadA family conjugal transfer-associated ATPase [Tetrasphaera sp.]|nr:TadA family conjugal transfer-associated ATPase [Tetrasphaera sp.]